MARTRLDKFKSLFKFHKWGHSLGARELVRQLRHESQTLSDAELDEYVAALPEDVLRHMNQWAAKHPTDETGWHEWMGKELWYITSEGCFIRSMEEKQGTRTFVERIRCAIARVAPDEPPGPATEGR